MCLLMSLEDFRSCKERSFEIEELLQNKRDGLNSEFAEEHPHESNNLKEDDADD